MLCIIHIYYCQTKNRKTILHELTILHDINFYPFVIAIVNKILHVPTLVKEDHWSWILLLSVGESFCTGVEYKYKGLNSKCCQYNQLFQLIETPIPIFLQLNL